MPQVENLRQTCDWCYDNLRQIWSRYFFKIRPRGFTLSSTDTSELGLSLPTLCQLT